MLLNRNLTTDCTDGTDYKAGALASVLSVKSVVSRRTVWDFVTEGWGFTGFGREGLLSVIVRAQVMSLVMSTEVVRLCGFADQGDIRPAAGPQVEGMAADGCIAADCHHRARGIAASPGAGVEGCARLAGRVAPGPRACSTSRV